MYIIIKSKKIELCDYTNNRINSFSIDFTTKKFLNRIKNIHTKEALPKAVGIKNTYFPNIIDTTAGLGKDSVLLAALGCQVTMFERNPIIAFCLQEALKKAKKNTIIGQFISDNIKLFKQSSLQMIDIPEITKPEVIYLDPMLYTLKIKSSPKREIHFLKKLIKNADQDAYKIFSIAIQFATKRVVVKRPLNCTFLNNIKTKNFIKTKKNRFDIYFV
ncbi:16S rRNA methyltransferase [Buchnera aphidicola (Thelaxes californica)]|uniref:16S rRNA methyltransferase n=1 Tax=Buchnera aphidicola (Thelaxes californica) TaxID=1315998 RepID=A0A4D6YLQ0_9GAMM|nr:class I SAM-dependent methyltransferase [Buchnera aphidicola]QCI26970.1 16S rRNA methyltransferase [Buchnera aphidicola (Thelaxes californica)]